MNLDFDVVDQLETLVNYLCHSQELEDVHRALDLLSL